MGSSTSNSTASLSSGSSTTRACASSRRAPSSPVSLKAAAKRARPSRAGLPRRPPMDRDDGVDSRLPASNVWISSVEKRLRSRPAYRPAEPIAPLQSGWERRNRPARRDDAMPLAKSALETKVKRQSVQGRSDFASSAWPVTTTTGAAWLATADFGDKAHEGYAAKLRHELCLQRRIGGAIAAGRTGCEHDRGDLHASSSAAGVSPERGCGRDTISMSRPACTEPPDVGRRHGHIGQQSLQHPIETVLLGAARAARRTQHRDGRARRPIISRLPGSTGIPR